MIDLEILRTVFAGLTLLATASISALLFHHSRKKEKIDLFIERWKQQQSLNLLVLQNVELRKSHETLVYGEQHDFEKHNSQILYILFYKLNEVQTLWFAKKRGVIGDEEFLADALPTLNLLYRKWDIVKHALDRGYDPKFAKFVLELKPKLVEVKEPN